MPRSFRATAEGTRGSAHGSSGRTGITQVRMTTISGDCLTIHASIDVTTAAVA